MSYIGNRKRRLPKPAPKPVEDNSMKGLGDLVEKVTTYTGIKAVVDTVAKATGKDCGCKKRKDKLNKLVPFKNPTQTDGHEGDVQPG